MRKILFLFLCGLTLAMAHTPLRHCIESWTPMRWRTEKIVYRHIENLHQPSLKDYRLLQAFLTKGKRPQLRLLQDVESRYRQFRLIGKKSSEVPEQGDIAVNCEESDRDNCLLVYASFNKSFAQGLRRLVQHVSESDFKGHILYRIGGWPNTEEGDLRLAHVPYAFKVCFFREAQRLGFKKALWLDTSVLPAVSLNQIFNEIERKGYFAMGNSGTIAPFMNAKSAEQLGVSMSECAKIPSCEACIVGFDFSHPKAAAALHDWHAAARNPYAFFSARSDQNALSVILYKRGMQEMAPLETLQAPHLAVQGKTLFTIDRWSVHQ